ncbi:MAG TPA: DUF5319 family protein [Actinomycetota bacterium]
MAAIDPEERESILEELEDLDALRTLFAERGFKGVMITCAECGEDHYYGWDMLKESLEYMLDTGEPRMHEPAFEPRPDDYIGWDYGRGFLDARSEIGVVVGEAAGAGSAAWDGDRSRCAYCAARLPQRGDVVYCPRCGASQAPLRLVDALAARGMSEGDIAELMDECGFPPPSGIDDRS